MPRRPATRTVELPSSKEGKLKITRIEAAVFQLETAITLSMNDGDPMSIITLLFASYGILQELIDGHPDAWTSLLNIEVWPKELRNQINALIKGDSWFGKHGGKDPLEFRYLSVNVIDMLLFDAV